MESTLGQMKIQEIISPKPRQKKPRKFLIFLNSQDREHPSTYLDMLEIIETLTFNFGKNRLLFYTFKQGTRKAR